MKYKHEEDFEKAWMNEKSRGLFLDGLAKDQARSFYDMGRSDGEKKNKIGIKVTNHFHGKMYKLQAACASQEVHGCIGKLIAGRILEYGESVEV